MGFVCMDCIGKNYSCFHMPVSHGKCEDCGKTGPCADCKHSPTSGPLVPMSMRLSNSEMTDAEPIGDINDADS